MFHADDDTWDVTFSRAEPRPGYRALIFHCVSNSSKPYRVVEVPSERVPDERAVEGLSEAVLRHLFAQSDPMGIVRDPAADPDHPGAHPAD